METVQTEAPAKSMVPFVEGRGLVPNDFDGMYRMALI